MAARDADALVADVLLGRENFLDRLDEVVRVRPDAPVVVMSAQTTAATAIGASKAGAFEYLPKPFDLDDLVAVLNRALEISDNAPVTTSEGFAGLVGRSTAMQTAFRTLGRLSQNRFPILFLGPGGTGRAAAARVLHRESAQNGELIELGPHALEAQCSEALNKSSNTTLLLRRMDDWSEWTQSHVLEALEREDNKLPRLLVTASHKVREIVDERLIDRLAVGLVEIPPLRQRGSDRALLFEYFLSQQGRNAFHLEDRARDFINSQSWPGEVQQLRRTAERICAQELKGAIDARMVSLAMEVPTQSDPDTLLTDAAARYFGSLHGDGATHIAQNAQNALDSGLIKAALETAGGVRQEAAKLLGMNRNTFAKRISDLESRTKTDV
jgi:two-component system nitrogen regulation response regulator GlnG